MVKRYPPSDPQAWRSFFKNQAKAIRTCDFFSSSTAIFVLADHTACPLNPLLGVDPTFPVFYSARIGMRDFDVFGIGVAVRDIAVLLDQFPTANEKFRAREFDEAEEVRYPPLW